MGTLLFNSERFFFCNIGWLLLVMILIPGHAFSQVTVSGEVVSQENGEALPAVNIQVKGTTTGTTSDANGQYELTVESLQGTLVVSFVGYQTQEVPINGRTEIEITLQSEAVTGEELVVVGYREQSRENITGSVSSVNVSDLQATSNLSASRALQGNSSGVQVRTSGSPGESARVNIRGISTFGDSQPLILVDGIESSLDQVDPDNIESMQVLKDAGAAAIYGVRGANGVILVTTKEGQQGLQVSYTSSYGIQFPAPGNPYNLMNPREKMEVRLQANPDDPLYRNGLPDYFYLDPASGAGFAFEGDPAVDPSNYNFDPSNPANNYIIQKINKDGSNWYQEVFDPAPVLDQNLSVSGGGEDGNFLLSLGHLNQQGTMLNTQLKQYSMRVNSNYYASDNIRFGEKLRINYRQNPIESSNTHQFSTLANIYQYPTLLPKYDIGGNYSGTRASVGIGSRGNPYSDKARDATDINNNWNIMGNVFAEVDPLENLTLRTSFGGDIATYYSTNIGYRAYESTEGWQNPNSYSESSSYNARWIWSNTANFSANITDRHDVSVLLGTEAIVNKGRSLSGSREEYFSTLPDYMELDNGTSQRDNSSGKYENTLFSMFGNINYNFDSTYLLEATVRRDGSSQFGSQNRYGIFPSFSVGWRISNESFMSDLEWMDNLLFKGSYGILGSQNNIGAEDQFDLYGSNSQQAYPIGGGPTLAEGFYRSQFGNPRTGWERNILTNLGFDLTVLQNFNFSFEYFKKEVDGLLFLQRLPAVVGGADPPTVNIGDIRNRGVDITASYTGQINRDFQFTVKGNFSTYANEVVDVPDPGYFYSADHQQLGDIVRNEEGHPVSSFYGYDVVGLFQSQEDVDSSPPQTDAAPGRFKYRDVDGDGEITPDDRTFIGNPNPDFTSGLNIALNYKNFDLSSSIYASYGAEIVNTTLAYTHFLGTYPAAKSKDLLNAWTPENTNTMVPKVENSGSFSTTGTMNSFYVDDGSYLRMQHLMLGYTVPSNVLQSWGLSKFRIYVMARNIFTLTNYSGIDPEAGSDGGSAGFGVDYGSYPNERSLTAGIELEF